MRTIEITEAKEWKQTLIDVAQSIQDKAAIQGELSEWDKRVYDEVVEIEKKLDSIEQKESKSEIPRAYEWHNYETGHCYIDYVPHVDGKSNILDEKNGYTKIPLYAQQPQKVEQEEEKKIVKCTCNNSLEYENCDKNCERRIAEIEEENQHLSLLKQEGECYPREFVEWVGVQELFFDHDNLWIFETDEYGVVWKKTTTELFEYWQSKVKPK